MEVDNEAEHGGRRGRITMNKHHGGGHEGRFSGNEFRRFNPNKSINKSGGGGRRINKSLNKSGGRRHGGSKGGEFGSDYSDYLSSFLKNQLKKEGIESN